MTVNVINTRNWSALQVCLAAQEIVGTDPDDKNVKAFFVVRTTDGTWHNVISNSTVGDVLTAAEVLSERARRTLTSGD